MESNDTEFPGLHRRQLTVNITWRFYKHWGQGYLAGEGRTDVHGDHSGGLKMIGGLPMVSAPCVAQARIYESAKGWLSAVFSYPNGIGIDDHYFWEIYSPDSDLMSEPERFRTEEEMERRVIELLSPAAAAMQLLRTWGIEVDAPEPPASAPDAD